MAAGDMDLMQGTLDLLVLKALMWGPRHGYAVARWVRETTDDDLQVEETEEAAAETPAVAGVGVGPLGKQPEGQVLPAHDGRAEAVAGPHRQLESVRPRRDQGSPDRVRRQP